MDLQHSLVLLYPEVALCVAAMALLMIGAIGGPKSSGLVSGLAILSLLGAAALAAVGPRGTAFGAGFVADAASAFARVAIYAMSAVGVLLGDRWLAARKDSKFEFPILVMLAAVGMGMMAAAGDLISLYVGVELQSLALYVLAAFRRNDARASEAGLKYFVLGALSSGLLLYGASLIYGFAGSTHFADIAAAVHAGAKTGVLFGLVFLICGLAFKVSAAPFHMWTPDVYEGAPTPVTLFFGSAPKVAAVLLATRLCVAGLAPATDAWRQIVIFAALASIFLGAVGAFGQTNIKRLLAYSSINNVGFALIGLAAGGTRGASSVLFYMAVYVVMTLGAFLCVLWMRDEEGRPVESIASLSGLAQTRPGFAWAFSAFMWSLAGIPPFFGFWPKLLVFRAAIGSGYIALAVAGILGTVIGAYYYMKIIKVMFMDEPAKPFARTRQPIQAALILVAAVAISPLGYLLIQGLGTLSDRAAGSLF